MSSFDRHMRKRGLMPSTQDKYASIIQEAEDAGADGYDILEWLQRKIHARVPIGTVLPLRAAVKHYLVSEMGYSPEEAQDALPKAKGVPSRIRDALNVNQLAIYFLAVEEYTVEPSRTILMLLPPTGMRIGEITRLQKSEIERRGDRWQFRFRGKGGVERKVPLNSASVRLLEHYFEDQQPKGQWVFPNQMGSPISQHTVRKYTRKIAAAHPNDLPALSPHVLRHTAASLWLKQGKDLKTVQVLLGHKNIATTSRYLHPDNEMLQDAVDSFDSLMPRY
jgi:site-specific recombinase XerD